MNQRMCRDFIEMQKGQVVDAITIQNQMEQIWGVYPDRMLVALALDEMVKCNQAQVVGECDRYRKYLVK